MIVQIIELLQSMDFKPATDNIRFAKGGYRYPRTFKEVFKKIKLYSK